MSYTITYGIIPKLTFYWSSNNLSYVIINTYSGNSIVGTSGVQYGNYWITPDLSLNIPYTFKMNPYNSAGTSGISKTYSVDTTINVLKCNFTNYSYYTIYLQWYGFYYYTKVYRRTTYPYVTDFVDITNSYLTPYTSFCYDYDISGNTICEYNIQSYDSSYTLYNSNTFTFSNSAKPATDLSCIYYDFSSIMLSFTLPKNSYLSSYYYQLTAISESNTKSVTGSTSPLFLTDLSSELSYTCYIYTYLDEVLASISDSYKISTTNIYYISKTNIIGFYPFNTDYLNYASGTGVSDGTNNGFTISTSATITGSGSLYSDNNNTHYFNLPNFTLTNNGVTICFWAKINTSPSGWCRLFDFGLGSGSCNILLGFPTTVLSYAIFNVSSGSSTGGTSTGWNYTSVGTNWTFYALTIASSGSTNLYINNLDTSVFTWNGYPALTTYTFNYIGRSNWGGDAGIDAYYNNFLVANRVLTNDELKILYNYPSLIKFR